MNRDEFMELVYETFADEPDNVLANGIIEAADAYVENEKAQLFTGGTTSDLISRQAAIDAMNTRLEDIKLTWRGKVKIGEIAMYLDMRGVIETLPSAQPEKEKAKRVLWTGWKGHRDTRYKCPNCKKPVKNDDIYCHRCGQKLMFPHISFTDYVPGEKQETIVRWDDE